MLEPEPDGSDPREPLRWEWKRIAAVSEPVCRPILFVWRKWPAGACVAAMGLLAAYYAIFVTPPLSGKEKAGWIVGLFVLFVLEISVIFKERARQDREQLEQIAKIEAWRSSQDKIFQEFRAASESRTGAILRLLVASNDPATGLKSRTLHLSERIIDFVYRRMENAPKSEPYKPPKTVLLSSLMTPKTAYDVDNDPWEQLMQTAESSRKIAEYENQTVVIYIKQFRDQVEDILIELESSGVKNSLLSQAQGFVPTCNVDILTIGEGLGRFAGELPLIAGRTV
jgi:hypothetical protein